MTADKEETIWETLTDEQAYRRVEGDSILSKSMQVLKMLHKLDPETCLKVSNDDDNSDEKSRNCNSLQEKLNTLLKQKMHSDKFVRRGTFWHQSRKF